MDLRRLRCVGLCACGGALVVLVVPSLRFILASQAGLVTGWRIAAMPPNILAHPCKVFAIDGMPLVITIAYTNVL